MAAAPAALSRLTDHPWRAFALTGLLIAAMLLAFEVFSPPSPKDLYERLSTSEFEEPLPSGISLDLLEAEPDPLEGYVGSVDFWAGHVKTDEMDGTPAYVSYRVLGSVDDARARYIEQRQAAPMPIGDLRPEVFQVSVPPVVVDHYCVDIARVECTVLIDSTMIEVRSSLDDAGLSDPHIEELITAAVAHLERVRG